MAGQDDEAWVDGTVKLGGTPEDLAALVADQAVILRRLQVRACTETCAWCHVVLLM